MPEYRLSLDFTAADDTQAERLAEAWADTCAAEYGTRYGGVQRLAPHTTGCLLPVSHLGPCTTTISPARPAQPRFCVTIGHETVPATTVGTYDDGDMVYPDTAYCAKCAEVMSASGDWTAGSELSTHPPDASAVACEWCGRAIYRAGHVWLAVKGVERGYNPLYCDANDDDGRHEPAATGT